MRLLSKGDELCLNPQTLRNNWVWWHMPETPVLVVGVGDRQIPCARWSVSVIKTANSRFTERRSQQRWGAVGDGIWCQLWLPSGILHPVVTTPSMWVDVGGHRCCPLPTSMHKRTVLEMLST